MKVLELFSGTQSISKEFRKKGHETLCIELNPIFTNEKWDLPQLTMSVLDLTSEMVIEKLGGKPDIIWASPVCTTHSIAAISTHRIKIGDFLFPKSDKAFEHDRILKHTLNLIKELDPKLYFIENPRGGMRKSKLMQNYNNAGLYTITYCQYGDNRMKPTDIWTNHPYPMFKPMCSNGDSCHEKAPRGSKTGTQGLKGNLERSMIPKDFCKYIVELSEEYVNENI